MHVPYISFAPIKSKLSNPSSTIVVRRIQFMVKQNIMRKKERRKTRARLVSSEFFHWTRLDLDMCPRVDTCPRSNVSNEKIHWTQAWPIGRYPFFFYEVGRCHLDLLVITSPVKKKEKEKKKSTGKKKKKLKLLILAINE